MSSELDRKRDPMKVARGRRIIALDPGGTTGVAIFQNQPISEGWNIDSLFNLVQLAEKEHHKKLWQLLTGQDPDVVVCERFDSPMPVLGGPGSVNIDAREYIGVTKLYCYLTGKPCVMQTRASRNLWTPDKLRKLGLWIPEQKHAMDALRHLLYFLNQEGMAGPFLQRIR